MRTLKKLNLTLCQRPYAGKNTRFFNEFANHYIMCLKKAQNLTKSSTKKFDQWFDTMSIVFPLIDAK